MSHGGRDDDFRDEGREPREEIAIIAMAGRFPGARNVDEFWSNLRDGVESIRSFSDDELTAAGVDAETRANPAFVGTGALADDLDCFDAAFFGIGRREAEIMDPQHRVFLEVAWEALERAGYDPESYEGLIGVFGGVAPNTYRNAILNTRPELLATVGDYLAMICSEREYAVTRTAFKLNLRGASMTVNTACSTSGVALHLACQSLLSGENDLCLVGGARVRAPLTAGYVYQEDGIPSPDGHCRAFDVDARGTMIGNGAAMIVVKRLSDALHDRDPIHAIVKSTAVNNDGSAKVGFTAPGVRGQSAVIAEAIALAEISADSIGYLEAHGTGTALGDPIEVAAASKAFRETTDRRGFCGIGSVKTNIGHLDAGAGIAGVIKAALALEHAEIPPSLNYTQPNPQIDFERSPFFVVDRLRPWERDPEHPDTPRRAGVSSFGLGGTNVHIVLEEPPPVALAPPQPPSRRSQLWVWSARTEAGLERATEGLSAHLDAHPELELDAAVQTLQSGRRRFGERRVMVSQGRDDALRVLGNPYSERIVTQHAGAEERPTVFLFPGASARYTGMGRNLYEVEPVFRTAIDRCLAFVARETDTDLRDTLYPDPATASGLRVESERPSVVLPLLFSLDHGLARLWTSFGLSPVAMLGHGVGEYVAACEAGVITLEDALRIVMARGRLFEKLEPVAMLGIPMPESEVRDVADGLCIAAVNQPDSCVVSGSVEEVEELRRELEGRDIHCTRIRNPTAAHSRFVEPILDEFRAVLEQVDFREPEIPFISNVSGSWIGSDQAIDPGYWVEHLRKTVRFADGLATVMSDGDRLLIEAGPGQTLSALARQHPVRSEGHTILPSMQYPREMVGDDVFLLESLGRAWLAGARIDWKSFHGTAPMRRVALPTYPFERDRYWVEPGSSAAATIPSGMVASESLQDPELPRKERIRNQLAVVIQDLSGLDESEIDIHATFVELGFDSLLLTQANTAFRRLFEVPISFRQLLEDAPTLDQLAAYIDAKLPEHDSRLAVEHPSETPGKPLTTSRQPKPEEIAATASMGPWRPPDTTAGDGLTHHQQRHLDALIERFTSRTQGSKQHTQASREFLSDPRAAAGFRRIWKELVYPIVADRASGTRLWDVDGNEWLDITMGFGVTLFGHSPQFITDAIREQLDAGMAIGPQTSLAAEVAGLVCELTGLERAAFCNTGSEAVLAAIRAARTVTARDRIVVFANDYHGIFDEVLARNIAGRDGQRVIPVAPGIPYSAVDQVIVLEYGAPESLEIIASMADEIAAVVVEPIQSRNPELQPRAFLHELRELTSDRGVALVFDEMITGFRLAQGGAQAWYGVQADIATYGKVIGGGMPIGVVAGQARFLDALDGGTWQFGDDSVPEAGVTWFSGTFVRHPLTLAATRAALRYLKQAGPNLQIELNARSAAFVNAMNEWYAAGDYPVRLRSFASLFSFEFAQGCEYAPLYFHYLRDLQVHCHERRPHFFTTAHDDEDFETLRAAFRGAAEAMREADFFPARGQTAAPGERPVALTEAQLEIWLASQIDDDASRAFHISGSIDIEGELDRDSLGRAIDALVARHESLRVRVATNAAVQYMAPSLRIEPREVDLSGLEGQVRAERLEEFHRDDEKELFELGTGPLIRFSVVRLEETLHRIVLTAHHMACDGWSLGILMRDLGALYGAELTGETPTLAPDPLQFGDFAVDQLQRKQGPEGVASEQYWCSRFEGELPVLDLPTDRSRPPVKTYRGGQLGIDLDSDFLDDLKAAAVRSDATLFATLLTTYSIFLKRLAGCDDVVIGVATAGQPSAGSGDLVGHCVNLYPFRTRTERDETLSSHLAEIRGGLLGSLEHRDYTFGSLIQKLALPRDPGRLPLMSTIITYETETSGMGFGDLGVQVFNNPKHYCNFDIELYFTELRDGLRVEFHYNGDLFDTSTIERWLEHMRALLRAVADVDDLPAAELPILGPGEQQRLTFDWNATSAPLPAHSGVHEWIEQNAAAHPDAPALVAPASAAAGSGSESGLTYGELNARANQL
ncbi:MAG: aminotransferase class III-fold pyridoxal phosphate-dependent enzyme, partial [bacterium]|nr:aminotransferase class III-fold pyridoxal phosphate-dependent enzyme [bacterium]